MACAIWSTSAMVNTSLAVDAARAKGGGEDRQARGEVVEHLEVGARAALHRVEGKVGHGVQPPLFLLGDEAQKRDVLRHFAPGKGIALPAQQQERGVRALLGELEDDLARLEVGLVVAADEQADARVHEAGCALVQQPLADGG